MFSLLGFAVLAASLGPGYVYERVAERRRPATPRSSLVESVELVVIGATCTITVALAVLVVARMTGWLNLDRLTPAPGTYFAHHPGRALTALATLYVVSFSLAWGAANLVYRTVPARILPGDTPWHVAFIKDCPSNSSIFVVLSLRDGSQIGGRLNAYTLEPGDNREIVLKSPIARRETPTAAAVQLPEDFVLVRESDVGLVQGHYVSD